jgi:hypothetical protein
MKQVTKMYDGDFLTTQSTLMSPSSRRNFSSMKTSVNSKSAKGGDSSRNKKAGNKSGSMVSANQAQDFTSYATLIIED